MSEVKIKNERKKKRTTCTRERSGRTVGEGEGLSVEQKALARMGRTGKKERWYARGMKREGERRRNAKKGRENKKHRADRALNRAI